MTSTIVQTSKDLHRALKEYIEAAYHVSHPILLDQRCKLLDQPGVIHQQPFIESTPRYRSGPKFADLGLDSAILTAFTDLSNPHPELGTVIHDPPYEHQADSSRLALVNGKSLVVMTGTGSGKTECFLLPILGKLARESRQCSEVFRSTPAIRAMILYPMNALVNDQLGRLRMMFGDPRLISRFMEWSGRPARFARYTSRTLYPGVRDSKKDSQRLAPIRDYYIRYLEKANGEPSAQQHAADELIHELKARGKWPAKPDLESWFGVKNARWRDRSGNFKRCVTLPNDPELLTRHEVQVAPPDILVTNYSMLEYMLMRPLERPIFDATRDWLKNNPNETFLLVVDEAHLYRGAAGTEVALLIRRLTKRLGIKAERLQVICTSASFENPDNAQRIGSELTGKDISDFQVVRGELNLRESPCSGSLRDAIALANVDIKRFYEASTEEGRHAEVKPFLEFRGVTRIQDVATALHDALSDFPPLSKLVNLTMVDAYPVNDLSETLFPGVKTEIAETSITNLVALGSFAKRSKNDPGLIPCRVHAFFRGLAGLWACMDPDCEILPRSQRGGPTGKLYSQPRANCDCGARVLELYTCRNCGTAYGRAYTDNVLEPDYLWSEPGGALRTHSENVEPLEALDLLLENPSSSVVTEPAEYDLVTGRLNPHHLGARNRLVHLCGSRFNLDEDVRGMHRYSRGEFRPCAVCGQNAAFGRSSVQDHQTKGDQPFQALIAKQIEIQPPSPRLPTKLAPHRGRKVLIFADSRQTAARLAPNIQTYSTRDAVRPLVVYGYAYLLRSPIAARYLSLENVYLSVMIAAESLGVRLRPEIKSNESHDDSLRLKNAINDLDLTDSGSVLDLLINTRSTSPPESLLRAINTTLCDANFSLESLALASIIERSAHTAKLCELPTIPGIAESDTQKIALARVWLKCWQRVGFWLTGMPGAWRQNEIGFHSGRFQQFDRFLIEADRKAIFRNSWLPTLLETFTVRTGENKHLLMGRELSLMVNGDWSYCQSCRTAQRPFPERSICTNCGRDDVSIIDPNVDPVFRARKGYYRASTVDVMEKPPRIPMALIAAEHTAQLNAAQGNEVFSKAEEHELLFQDINLGPRSDGQERPAIDILSSTTTMEVGIDIGLLSGVSLRNIPPSRANYQQRAGRAGRRANSVATVTSFASADSHDEHYFANPELMVRGPIEDPVLTLDNTDIARRHMTAYLLQRYHQTKLPEISPEEQPQLFAVLGTVQDFKNPSNKLNRFDFERWLQSNESMLVDEISQWLPHQIEDNDRETLLRGIVLKTMRSIDIAIGFDETDFSLTSDTTDVSMRVDSTVQLDDMEVPDEKGEEQPVSKSTSEYLLDRFFYQGVLPRYAFPTDVASFYVFDPETSSNFRHSFQFSPSQGLPVALTQYAPGKEVWIGNKLWTSGAIYSPMNSDRQKAWKDRQLYFECKFCRFARLIKIEDGSRGETRDCEACGSAGTFGPARYWMRPPGFAHPVNKDEGVSPEDQPARSYATRAKLTMPTPTDEATWRTLSPRVRVFSTRANLLVTNRGPREDGYSYCTDCGLIAPTSLPNGEVHGKHLKPYPDDKDQNCTGNRVTNGLVLGTDFISDVLLISSRVDAPLSLKPEVLATEVALRTICEAITIAACTILELEANELQAEYRPALTQSGRDGREAEIYVYDTLPGGAGFARRTGELGLTVFNRALSILEKCPANCDSSCYECLRSYKNKFEHDLLDRHIGASLLKFLITGTHPELTMSRMSFSMELLFQDLLRHQLGETSISRDVELEVAGIGHVMAPILVERENKNPLIIGLRRPLTEDEPLDPRLREVKEFSASHTVLLEDEIAVRKNLPATTSRIISSI